MRTAEEFLRLSIEFLHSASGRHAVRNGWIENAITDEGFFISPKNGQPVHPDIVRLLFEEHITKAIRIGLVDPTNLGHTYLQTSHGHMVQPSFIQFLTSNRGAEAIRLGLVDPSKTTDQSLVTPDEVPIDIRLVNFLVTPMGQQALEKDLVDPTQKDNEQKLSRALLLFLLTVDGHELMENGSIDLDQCHGNTIQFGDGSTELYKFLSSENCYTHMVLQPDDRYGCHAITRFHMESIGVKWNHFKTCVELRAVLGDDWEPAHASRVIVEKCKDLSHDSEKNDNDDRSIFNDLLVQMKKLDLNSNHFDYLCGVENMEYIQGLCDWFSDFQEEYKIPYTL